MSRIIYSEIQEEASDDSALGSRNDKKKEETSILSA